MLHHATPVPRCVPTRPSPSLLAHQDQATRSWTSQSASRRHRDRRVDAIGEVRPRTAIEIHHVLVLSCHHCVHLFAPNDMKDISTYDDLVNRLLSSLRDLDHEPARRISEGKDHS
ncbi:hypothetical protein N657DRAFT_647317, partial [Parathielavia appendiculata]